MLLLKRTAVLTILISLFLADTLAATTKPVGSGTDRGYIFVGPREVKKTKQIKKGVRIVAYHQRGVFVSEQSDSPCYQAALFIQGTTIEDAKGKVLQDVALCEATDADGDLNWSIFWRPNGETGTIAFKLGTGKWEGITGAGRIPGMVRKRADDHVMPQYEIQWKIAPNDRRILNALDQKERYKYHDKGLSFHGPHIMDFSRGLANGTKLVISSQSGVLLSDNPEAKSPRNFATCYDRGTTITTTNGNGDIMLLEDTDPDGDVVWLCHIWWYGKGDGTYEFIGGTGKWQGITGVGVTRGILRGRTDDHFMLKSEMHWNIGLDRKAPEFSAKTFDGKTVRLSDYLGKIVVLEWFNFECPFVKAHYKDGNTTMIDLAQKYKDQDVVWLAVNSTNHTTPAGNLEFTHRNNLPYPILDDRSGKIGHAYNATNTPHMFIINSHGNIVYEGAVDNAPLGKLPEGIDGKVNYIDQALMELCAGNILSTEKTKPYGCTVKYAK